MSARPSAEVLRVTPGGFLLRTDLEALGLPRRAVDSVFRELDVVVLPGFARPMVRAEEFRALVERCTYGTDRVRPC